MTSQDLDLNDLNQPTNLNIAISPMEQKEEIEGIPFQHEDEETFQLRIIYEDALRGVSSDLDENTITVIASMVVKKARYGVNYEDELEQLIEDFNEKIQEFYSQQSEG